MSLEVISKNPKGEVTNTIISEGEKNNRHTEDFDLECNGKEKAGIISIKIPHHHIKIDLIERSVTIKDLGTEIRVIK